MRSALASISALLVLLVACEPPDAGLLVEEGLELHQAALPVAIDCGDVDCGDAIDAWQGWLGRPAFQLDDPARVTVVEAELEPETYGAATLLWDLTTGEIVSCAVELQAREWWPEVLEHELGHCLGLDDVEYSIGGSIMSVPTWEGAGLSCNADCAALVLGALDE